MVEASRRPAASEDRLEPVPALAVAMLAAGPAPPMLATLRSLALDTEVPGEILLIEDGVQDPTAIRLYAQTDSRIRIVRQECSRDRLACLDRAIAEGAAPLVTLLRPGDVVLPGALRVLSDAMRDDPDVGMVHAYCFPLDSTGHISRSEFQRYGRRMAHRLPAGIDHRRAVVVQGHFLHGLPTFRRDVLCAAGGLAGGSLDEAVYSAALRVLSVAEVRLVPRLLCGRSWPEFPQDLGAYLKVLTRCARAIRDGRAEYLRTARYRFGRLAGIGFLRQLGESLPRAWMGHARSAAQRLLHAVRSSPAFEAAIYGRGPYELLGALLRQMPVGSLHRPRARPRPRGDDRVAYVLWRYAESDETFIRGEVRALRSTGLHLDVFALESASASLPTNPESPAASVTCFGPPDIDRGRGLLLGYLRRRPWTVIRLWLLVARHSDPGGKTWRQDRDVLYLSAQLAARLAERRTTHVHSPQASHSALLALVASRLQGVTYSVEARASEVHQSAHAALVAGRLRSAEFVVANSRYNERCLHSLLGGGPRPSVHVIYDGVELRRFLPAARSWGAGPLRILAVGRLVETKGFLYLLEACRLLRDRGREFTCEIVGGPEDQLGTVAWVELRKLHRALQLESIVHFRGAMGFSGVLAAYQRAHIFVLPSVRARDGSHDITPSALIEAMAMRLPVVSTTVGAIPEIVNHEVEGLLVPPNDALALADALEALLRNADLRDALGEAGRRKVEQQFDIADNVAQWRSLFCRQG